MKGFKFGIEAEFLLADEANWKPLWHHDLKFSSLNEVLESIDLSGIPSLAGLELEKPHRKLMPYVVEGYHVPDQDFSALDIMPKGIEIRTPVCSSLDECLEVYKLLFDRLTIALQKVGIVPVALSHHPLYTTFSGPQNKRRHDFWQWAMEVMTTFGSDINVSFPQEVAAKINDDDLVAKINYYCPAMTAFTVASPFWEGKPWEVRQRVGKSVRTFRRSIIAPPIEIHPDEDGRYEFKMYEMTSSLSDFKNQFLLFIALVLDDSLKGRATKASRIYDMGNVAQHGFNAEFVRERGEELLAAAKNVLPQWGFPIETLARWDERLAKGQTPADDLLTVYQNNGQSLAAVLKTQSYLHS